MINPWANSNIGFDYNIFDIDRQKGLEKYTDFEFSASDKIKGTAYGVKNEAIKDINNAKDSLFTFSSSFKTGGKVLILLFAINLVMQIIQKVKKWA